MERLSIVDDIVTYTTKDGTAHDFTGLDFLALLTSHIPKKWESLTRYYGFYSSRARGNRGAKNVESLIEGAIEPKQAPSSSWARCMKRIFEFNPLECPKCKGIMRIVAFLHDESAIKKIMDSEGIPIPEPPVPIPKAPTDESLFIDEIFE